MLLGDYTLVQRLAEAPIFTLYLARHNRSQLWSLISVIRNHLLDDTGFINRLTAQTRLFGDYRDSHDLFEGAHLFVPSGHLQHDERHNLYYTVRPHLPGIRLDTLIKTTKRLGLRFAPLRALSLIGDLCKAHESAHRYYEHRFGALICLRLQLEPDNVIVSRFGEAVLLHKPRVEAVWQNSSRTGAGIINPNFKYLSPEAVRTIPTDHRSDVFVLGTMLYELLAGHHPFHNESDIAVATLIKIVEGAWQPISEGIEGLGPHVDEVFAKAMASDLADRHDHTGDMLADFERCLRDNPQVPTEGLPHALDLVRDFAYKEDLDAIATLLLTRHDLHLDPVVTDYMWSTCAERLKDNLRNFEDMRWSDLVLWQHLPEARLHLEDIDLPGVGPWLSGQRDDTPAEILAALYGISLRTLRDGAVDSNEAPPSMMPEPPTSAEDPTPQPVEELGPTGATLPVSGNVDMITCSMDWDDLTPIEADPERRHCAQCDQDVLRVRSTGELALLAGHHCMHYDPSTSPEPERIKSLLERLKDWWQK